MCVGVAAASDDFHRDERQPVILQRLSGGYAGTTADVGTIIHLVRPLATGP